jgi:hypothetical protein
LLASLIAIYSIRQTHKNQIFLENDKANKRQIREEEIYCGLLNAAKIELIYHQKILPFLIEGLQKIRDASLREGEIITAKAPRNISLNFLQEIRRKIIDKEILDTNILQLLSYYINKCEIINMDMDFESLIKLNEKFKDKVDFQELVKDYFDKEIDQVKKIQESLTGIIYNLDTKLSSFNKPYKINED